MPVEFQSGGAGCKDEGWRINPRVLWVTYRRYMGR